MTYRKIALMTLFLSSLCLAGTPDVTSDTVIKSHDRILNNNYYHLFIRGVHDGKEAWLNKVPEVSEVIREEQSNDLMNALIHALIVSPNKALLILHAMDKEIQSKGHSPIRDKFGTDGVCAYLINTEKYDRASFFEYYARAKSNLDKAGENGKSCLDIMTQSVEETRYEEKRGRVKWGSEQYLF